MNNNRSTCFFNLFKNNFILNLNGISYKGGFENTISFVWKPNITKIFYGQKFTTPNKVNVLKAYFQLRGPESRKKRKKAAKSKF